MVAGPRHRGSHGTRQLTGHTRGPYAERWEAAATGDFSIHVDHTQDAVAARLRLELWGGHPGTANKRFAFNGGELVALPEVGTADNQVTYQYPEMDLALDAIVVGANHVQMSCEKGNSS